MSISIRGEDADVLAMRSLLRGGEGNGGLDRGEVANDAFLVKVPSFAAEKENTLPRNLTWKPRHDGLKV